MESSCFGRNRGSSPARRLIVDPRAAGKSKRQNRVRDFCSFYSILREREKREIEELGASRRACGIGHILSGNHCGGSTIHDLLCELMIKARPEQEILHISGDPPPPFQ